MMGWGDPALNGPVPTLRLQTFQIWLEMPQVKWAVPIPLLVALAPVIWLFFRGTWRELEEDALAFRLKLKEANQIDYRPAVALVLSAMILTLQEYYGNRVFYEEVVRKWLLEKQRMGWTWISFERYEELYILAWWALSRSGGYLFPLLVWRIFFRKDSILDFGLRGKGFFEHAWIYAMFVAIMIPTMMFVGSQPDFGMYYPFYKQASRSWRDFLIWEGLYIAQFFALEVFFRGFWVRACRSLGMSALFCMAVPYCMIHYGKPYLEACGAIVAGVVLASLSMRTKSIYAGFLVHITVAILMDLLALEGRKALPKRISLDTTSTYELTSVRTILWIVWGLSLLLLVVTLIRRRRQLQSLFENFRRSRGGEASS